MGTRSLKIYDNFLNTQSSFCRSGWSNDIEVHVFFFQATAQCAPIDLGRVDQMASNGILHVLNAVMIPPAGTIVSTLAACPVFKTLVEAVKVAGLVETLSSPGPFTVFAPSEKAFEKLPRGTIEKLLRNPTELASEFGLIRKFR